MWKYFHFRQGKIHYFDQGRGEVIVLLHGYLETSEVWGSFADKLAREFRVIAIDLPGHGRSEIFEEGHTMEFLALAVKELLENSGIIKVFIVGHSMGGYVTLAFAELWPDMISGYCLFHSHPFPDSPEALKKREREIALVKAGKKDLMYPENISRMFATSNLHIFSEALQRSKKIASTIKDEGIIALLKGMMARPSRLTVIEKGRIPCLWILGAMDNYINCEQILKGVKLPENAKVVVLGNSGHMGFVEEEDRTLDIIQKFVKDLINK
jgi:pimeloyl-ACP methyl ester carboxylesterase